MRTGTNPRAQFLEQLDRVDRIVGSICRRHRLSREETEDFASWVRLRLIENDYAVLRAFGGRSSLATYLTVVIANLYRDYRVARWGRWRPSAAARRLGPLAERLERLVYRDGHAFRQAVEVLRSEGVREPGDRELADLLNRLPIRAPLRPRPVGEAALERAAGHERADAGIDLDLRAAVGQALARALESLPAADQLVIRMRFWDDLSVAQIARALDLEQKPLYRRIPRILDRLRERLEREGIEIEDALGFLFERGAR